MGWTLLLWLLTGLLLLRLILSLRELLRRLIGWWKLVEDTLLYAHQSYKIPSHNDNLQENPLYRKAAAYINLLPSLEDSNNAVLFSRKPTGRTDLSIHLGENETVHDVFWGARVSWTDVGGGEALLLRVRKHDRRRILQPYLQHVEAVADEVEVRKKEVRLFTVVDGRWTAAPVPFTHPATMETVAMEPELKGRVKSDLESFLKNKAYYHRLGRVWKRSYLLYGPTGTGKSSFIAAMAKFVNYDVYDVDLSRVGFSGGSDLKSLLLQTSPRSVVVVEDLDHYLTSSSTSSSSAAAAASLTGVLNFMDGIFSCCGEERLMVFTMRDAAAAGIDPAMLRPGRVDVQLFFPLCDFAAFKTMASSYLGLKDHKLYPAVEESFRKGASLSQAEIGEIMIVNRGSPSRALKTVLSALQNWASSKRLGGSFGRRMVEQNLLSPPETRAVEVDGGGMLNKEFRKLYGLIRTRGGSRKEGFTAAAAAEAHHKVQLSSSSSSLDLPLQALLDQGKNSPS